MQVLQETGLVNGHQRAQAHRHRGELPEIRHQLGVRIGRQALAVDFLAEMVELVLGQAALPGRRGRTCPARYGPEVHQVAAVLFGLAMPEMVLAAADHGGQRGERGDMAAQVAAVGRVVLVGAHHHRHGVPAHVRADAGFQLQVAGMGRLQPRRNRVHVGGVRRERDMGAGTARPRRSDAPAGSARAAVLHGRGRRPMLPAIPVSRGCLRHWRPLGRQPGRKEDIVCLLLGFLAASRLISVRGARVAGCRIPCYAWVADGCIVPKPAF